VYHCLKTQNSKLAIHHLSPKRGKLFVIIALLAIITNVLVFISALLLFKPLTSKAALYTWSSQTIDSGSKSSLALNSSNNPSISYHKSSYPQSIDLMYATYVGPGGPGANCGPQVSSQYTWKCESIDNLLSLGVAAQSSLAFDSSTANPRLSYYNGNLRYAKYVGTSG